VVGLAELIAPPHADDPWSFAVPDWGQRLAEGRSLLPALPLDRVAVARAVGIFNKLRLPDVIGRPAFREAIGDWQRDMVASILGSVDDTGYRHVRECFCLVPKKNNKTTGGAGIMLTALLYEMAPAQSFFLYGPTQEIAERGFVQARGMIEADEVLKKRLHVQAHLKLITDRKTDCTLKVQTFDEKVATGAIPKGQMIDEVHILGKIGYAARLLGQLRGGMVSRADAFMLMITTQSDEPPAGVFRATLQLARAIRDGQVSGAAATLLPLLYEFPEEVQTSPGKLWRDPKIWPWVLPNLGRSIRLDVLEAEFAKAEALGNDELRRWASQHLNVEIGLALHSNRWRGADLWEAQADATLDLETLIARCDVAVVGIDGGGLDDLFGLCVAGRDSETGDRLVWAHAWCQRDVLDLRKDIAPRLQDFADQGDLTLCDCPTEDIEGVRVVIERLLNAGLLPEKAAVGLDPIGVAAVVDMLDELGLADDQRVAVAQGFRLSSAVWGAERKLKERTLWHAAQPLMDWCIGNVRAEQKGSSVLITKETAGKAKIDPVIAMFNALALLDRNPQAAEVPAPQIYVLA